MKKAIKTIQFSCPNCKIKRVIHYLTGVNLDTNSACVTCFEVVTYRQILTEGIHV
jgi:hypothetical protein